MNLKDRVRKLEGVSVAARGRWHRVIQDVGMTRDQAIERYGRDRIAERDHVIVRRVVGVPA